MIPYWVDAKNRMFLAYKGSYMNGVSNELEGHSLATGEKMWSRKMSHVYGWNESGLLDDSTRLIVSDGIHLVHMGNGEGPSYAMPTGASDYKEAVALGALGVVTGVLTGFAAVPTGPKKVMELVSNVLSDDTVFTWQAGRICFAWIGSCNLNGGIRYLMEWDLALICLREEIAFI